MLNPLDIFLVLTAERIRDEPVRQQIGVDASRDLGRSPDAR